MKHTSVLAKKQACLWLLIMAFVAVTSVGQALENIRITNDLTLGYNSITGDGKDQSSLSNGYEYQYLGGLKLTDDIRNDMKNISLTNL